MIPTKSYQVVVCLPPKNARVKGCQKRPPTLNPTCFPSINVGAVQKAMQKWPPTLNPSCTSPKACVQRQKKGAKNKTGAYRGRTKNAHPPEDQRSWGVPGSCCRWGRSPGWRLHGGGSRTPSGACFSVQSTGVGEGSNPLRRRVPY